MITKNRQRSSIVHVYAASTDGILKNWATCSNTFVIKKKKYSISVSVKLALTFSGEPRLLNGVRLIVDWIEDEAGREIILPGHQLLEDSLGRDMLRPLTLRAWQLQLRLFEPRANNLNRFVILSLSVVICRRFLKTFFHHGQQPAQW
jgi:hypothetical protein